MKISCPCGALISDSADGLSYKARLIADMDYAEYWTAIDSAFEALAEAMRSTVTDEKSIRTAVEHAQMQVRYSTGRYHRDMYQCFTCGRLLIDDIKGDVQIFEASDAAASAHLLRSIEGAQWRGFLRGSWRSQRVGSPKGELFWKTGVMSEGDFLQFDEFPPLVDKYHEVLQRLQEENLPCSAFLTKDEETIHHWAPAGRNGTG